MNKTLLQMEGICKYFPGVKALENVDFKLRAGEVHAILGENGAGKSTLIKILGGIYQADGGSIFINGTEVKIDNIHNAKLNGISVIHQELMLSDNMTVAENIFMGDELTKGITVNSKKMNQEAQKFLDLLKLPIKATDKLSSLTIANQQMVEIVRAISFSAKIIVMDEPTSSLSQNETELLFKAINELKKRGIGIIYISHRIAELEIIADRITVMRDGTYIDTVEVDNLDKDLLITLMVGRELKKFYIRDATIRDDIVLQVENLNDGEKIHDISFTLHKGEILGFAGLIGSGRTEIMQCIFGLRGKKSGKIYLNGQPVNIKSPKDAMRNKLAFVPENRKEEGLFLESSVKFNTTLLVLSKFFKKMLFYRKIENDICSDFVGRLSVKTANVEQSILELSGGNQQKVIISRWLATEPDVLILDEPTRGIDVGAKSEIYSLINDLTKKGIAIILISSEMQEIINMSDRIAVMNNGYLVDILAEELTQERIMALAAKEVLC